MVCLRYILGFITLLNVGCSISKKNIGNGKIAYTSYSFDSVRNVYFPIDWKAMGLPEEVPLLFYDKYFLETDIKTTHTTIEKYDTLTGVISGNGANISYDTSYWLINSANDSCYKFEINSNKPKVLERTVLSERKTSSMPRIVSKNRTKLSEIQLQDTTIKSVRYSRIKILSRVNATTKGNERYYQSILYLLPNRQHIPSPLSGQLESDITNRLIHEVDATTFLEGHKDSGTNLKISFTYSTGSLSKREKFLFTQLLDKIELSIRNPH